MAIEKTSSPRKHQKSLTRLSWDVSKIDSLPLSFTVGTSILEEFVLSHNPSDVLVELVQNEYDAEGTRIDVAFKTDSMTISGNGKPIDSAGWKRLSVMLGTGLVAGSDRHIYIKAKVNSIGSKNFGLRSLFIYGDRFYIRSGGYHTVFDSVGGTLTKPEPERISKHRREIHIELPYRTKTKGVLEAFSIEKEQRALTSFSHNLTPSLIKLAQPESKKSLEELLVTSERCKTRISWKQSVKHIEKLKNGVNVIRRTVQMVEIVKDRSPNKRRQTLEEIEFQKIYRIPEEFRDQPIPSYFRGRGTGIIVSLSLRIHRGKVDLSDPGTFYYPLGLSRGYTGNAVSINAPFQLNNDRTQIVEPSNSSWNEWLLDKAVDLTLELLVTDWYKRFGAEAYLALPEVIKPEITQYLEGVLKRLSESPCWPTCGRKRGPSKAVKFSVAKDIVIALLPELNNFLSDEHYLDTPIADNKQLLHMAEEHGAKIFGLNSLIRLRCAGSEGGILETKLDDDEANIYYKNFPDVLKDTDLQLRFANGLDRYSRRLSKANRSDLCNSETTLAADGSLQAPSYLWVVDLNIADVGRFQANQRLHPVLTNSKCITKLCKMDDPSAWVREVATRAEQDTAGEKERQALYRYILSVHAPLGRQTLSILRKSPVLLDHQGQWVSPRSVTLRRAQGANRLAAILHFPHKDYDKNDTLAKAFRFKNKVNGEDLIQFARHVENNPDLAASFEETLQLMRSLLKPTVVNQLSQLRFLRSTLNKITAPNELYLKNVINCACLGDESPFVKGSRNSLYKRLKCMDKPKHVDIINHLLTNKACDRKPKRPDVLYPTLVKALEFEQIKTFAYKSEPIIWNGKGYSSPQDTLIGSRHRKIFLEAVPLIPRASAILREAFIKLGVSENPQEQHWSKLFSWLDHKYQQSGGPVSTIEQRALREAYTKLNYLPESIANTMNCFLDEKRMLHSMADIISARYLINDEPKLAKALADVGSPISFADEGSVESLKFYSAVGVKSLTKVRKKRAGSVGQERQAPRWYKQQDYLEKLHSIDFISAIVKLVAHASKGRTDQRIISSSTLKRRLRSLESISFVNDIQVEYLIGKTKVSVPADFLIERDRIVVIWVRGSSELCGLLAKALAELLMDNTDDQRNITDAIFRLLLSRSSREMMKYLNDRGIPWKPTSDLEEEPEEEGYEYEEAEFDEATAVLNEIAKVFSGSLDALQDGGAEEAHSPIPTLPKVEEETEHKPPEPDSRRLPPIEDVSLSIIDSSSTWSPPSHVGGGGGSKWPLTPPTNTDVEWEKMLGRRGEELIFRRELERVKTLGYPASRVVWKSEEDPGADYDILSVDDYGEDLWLEVKSTTGKDGRFRWPKAEFERAIRKRSRYILCRVYEAHTTYPSVKEFVDPINLLLLQRMRLDIATLNAQIEPMRT